MTQPSPTPTSANNFTPSQEPFCVVLIVEATSSPLVPQTTATWLAQAADAIAFQLNNHVAPYYGGAYGVRVGAGPTDVQPGEVVFSIVDSLPQAPGAVAYHDVNGSEVPVAFLALSTCNTLDDVSTAISHELAEIAGDALCDLWADAGTGEEYAHELCDAVQANSYPVTPPSTPGAAPIAVSDFLLPSFWGTGAAGPYCFTQAQGIGSNYPTAPFATTSGGYQIVRDAGQNETQVTGKLAAADGVHRHGNPHVHGNLGIRAEKAKHFSSRTYRRGVRIGA